jgi:hypothetical protein
MADISNQDKFTQDEDSAQVIELDGEPFEIIGEIEHDGETYVALIPYEEEEADEEAELEFVILKEAEENGEYFLTTIDDEAFYEKLGKKFLELFSSGGQTE